MVRVRAIVSVLAGLALIAGLVAVSLAAQVWWALPTPQGRLVRGPHELVGVYSGRSYSWVVPTDDPKGVVLVDAGGDASATRIVAELRKGDREVRAILLTHAHGEQIMGLEAFPDVPVYVGSRDVDLLLGERAPGGWLARLYANAVERPAQLSVVEAQTEVVVNGARFVAVPTPGHTDGSLTWWWENVVFTGGALLAASPPAVSPSGLNDDDAKARESVEALLPLDFDAIADGRTGLATTARPQVHWMVGATVAPPTQTLSGSKVSDPATVARTGVYVEAWLPDPDGTRPGLVVDPTGRATVVRVEARAEDRGFIGRRVTAVGTPEDDGARLVDATLSLVDGQSAGDGRLPQVTSADQLIDLLHQWVVIEGTLSDLEPWSRGAAFGHGSLTLSGGETVPVTAPVGWEGAFRGLGTVSRQDGSPPLIVVRSPCESASSCRETPPATGSE